MIKCYQNSTASYIFLQLEFFQQLITKMARNEEKAMAMLNRWVSMKRTMNTKERGKRPENPMEIDTIQEAEQWRSSVIRELVRKVSDIQNASLGEHRIRDLNDEINNLIKLKGRWEDRIRELGGPDYRKLQTKMLETDGVELPGAEGYKYFGAAKNLPKVRELFQKETPSAPRISRNELYKRVTYRYLGYQDDSDLVKKEQAYEQEQRQKSTKELAEKYNKRKRQKVGTLKDPSQRKEEEQTDSMDIEAFKMLHSLKFNIPSAFTQQSKLKVIDDEEEEKYRSDEQQEPSLELPEQAVVKTTTTTQQAKTKEDLMKKLAEKKRQLLMKKYGSDQDSSTMQADPSLKPE